VLEKHVLHLCLEALLVTLSEELSASDGLWGEVKASIKCECALYYDYIATM